MFHNHNIASRIAFVLACVMACVWAGMPSAARAQDVIVTYPGSSHLQAEAGTIEYWFRLEGIPDPVDGNGQSHYFPMWSITKPGEATHRIRFVYGPFWKPENFHLAFLSWGNIQGKKSENPYVVSFEDTQPAVKLDRGTNKYPRIARLKKGEWHHVALTWTGQPMSTIAVYLDGKACVLPVQLTTPLWDELDAYEFVLHTNPYCNNITIDDLRISSIARSEQEILESAAAPTLKADRFTLLLDRFEELKTVNEKIFTTPEVFTQTNDATGGRVVVPTRAELNEGKSGKGLKLLKW